MEEAKRIALLEKENFELKEEVDTLFNTVVQLKESMNLLVSRYIVNEKSRSKTGQVIILSVKR